MLNYKITKWVIIKEFPSQQQEGTIIDKESKDWQRLTTTLPNGRLKESLLFNWKMKALSMKKEEIGSVQLQDYLMCDYRRVCYSTEKRNNYR